MSLLLQAAARTALESTLAGVRIITSSLLHRLDQTESPAFPFFETASSSEVSRRFRSEVFVTQVEVPVG